MATTRKWRDKEGNDKEDTQWHNVKLWGRQAEVANQYLKKGRQVFIEGRLETRQYEQDGQRKYFTEVVGEQMVLLGGRAAEPGNGGFEEPATQPANRGFSSSPKGTVGGEDEDLPF
jgi:single-strand DNA-binding protein